MHLQSFVNRPVRACRLNVGKLVDESPPPIYRFLTSISAICALGACASTEDVRALRRPELPPSFAARAEYRTPLYENVAVYEVLNVPEVRWFDGEAVFTTRPTRRDVIASLGAWLDTAHMLAPSIGEADYLLTLSFEELRGPDVIWFTDKHASATVHYTLTCQRAHRTRERMSYGDLRSLCTAPGQIVFEGTYQAQLQARMPGVTPEMVRAAIASGVLSAMLAPEIRDSADVVANAVGLGAILGDGAARGVGTNAFQLQLNEALDILALSWPALDDLTGFDAAESLGVLGAGLIISADNGEASPTYTTDRLRGLINGGLIGGIAADNGSTTTGDAAARWRGGAAGALIGMVGAAPTGRPIEEWNAREAIGAFDGTRRRHQAVAGMLRQNFNIFLFGLHNADLLRIREAVPCADLNPDGYNVGVVTSTNEVIGYDCPIGRTRPVRSF